MPEPHQNKEWEVSYDPLTRTSMIIPLDDEKEHLYSHLCECEPVIEPVFEGEDGEGDFCGVIYTHNSFDRRELMDQVYRIIRDE